MKQGYKAKRSVDASSQSYRWRFCCGFTKVKDLKIESLLTFLKSGDILEKTSKEGVDLREAKI